MFRRLPIGLLLFSLAASISLAAGEPPDTDGDGICNDHEAVLGTDPSIAESLQVVWDDGFEPEERRQRDGYDTTKDFDKIEFCHVGGDRYLWRATFAAEPRLDDTVFHLYVDADADSTTGRQGTAGAASTGTEYMLSVVGDRGTCGCYDAEGNRVSGPPVTHVVAGNTLLISADINLGRDDQGLRYALYVLCHTTTASSGKSPGMSDSSPKREISGIPVSPRDKITRPTDHRDNYRVAATFGHSRLFDTLGAKGNIVVPHDELERDGFSLDLFVTRRWPHVRLDKAGGRVWTAAPKSGRYHVGFMMYDDSNDERVGLYVEDKLHGVAVANQDNNQTWLYWLEDPCEFLGGERVELRAFGAGGKHGISNILFLAEAPQERRGQYTVENMTAASPVGHPGRVTISWTTTWPCPTHFEYGGNTSYGKTVRSDDNCLVHRVVLDGLAPQQQYHGRGIATSRDGSPVHGADFVFHASPPQAPATRPKVTSVPLNVRNPHTFDVKSWPITTGVPFPQGQLGSADHVRLVDAAGDVPVQVQLTGRWRDGSVKWLLLTFQATLPAEGQREYRLEFGRDVRRKPISAAVSAIEQTDCVAVDAGPLRFRIDAQGNLVDFVRDGRQLFKPNAACRSVATDAEGAEYSTTHTPAEVSIEESGPIRAVVKVTSHLANADGARLLRIEKRIEAYRGSPFVRVHHTFVVETPQTFAELDELAYRIPIATSGQAFQVPTVNGEPIRLDESRPTVWQRFDDELVVTAGDGETPSKNRVVGSIAAADGGGAVAVRDFWQNYPKAFSVRPDGIQVALCPAFEAGLYDEFPFEKQGHQLYYYLLGGRYRLKHGVAKTHELFLCFPADTSSASLCALFQKPLLATAPPDWYCGSKAFYDVAPRDPVRFKLYEEAIDRNLQEYVARRERQHDFGLMNYGDWYGERGTNWGNIEYDTQHAFFLEYIRSGNPDAFFLGETTELHNRDIDTVQWSDDPSQIGAVYVHQMCHVGEYYDKPVPGNLGFPRGGYTVSHAWTEGHFDHFFLTGDRRSYETGCAVADFFIRKSLGRPYDFSSTRTPGWHLIMLAAAYAATNDPYYLNASKVVVERVLETQDVQPRPLPAYQCEGRKPFQQGGWSRMMVPGHCQCEPRHRGNAGFMIAVLLSGLKYHHDVTGDPRVKECIIQGAHNLLDETYSDEVHGFRYTSCPKTGYRAGASPLMVEGVARAYVWTKEERFRRVLTEALPRAAGGSGYGKGFSMYYRMAPRLLADLAAAGISLEGQKQPDR